MIAVIQRANGASCTVNGSITGKIDSGMIVYLGVERGDCEETLERVVDRICRLRIFEDQNGKMNLSIMDTTKQLLLISQFTLCANVKKGTRPGFDRAEAPERARALYQRAIELFRFKGLITETGVFGAHMEIAYTNPGPATFILEERK